METKKRKSHQSGLAHLHRRVNRASLKSHLWLAITCALPIVLLVALFDLWEGLEATFSNFQVTRKAKQVQVRRVAVTQSILVLLASLPTEPPQLANGTRPITCPNVTGSSCFMSCALLLLKPAVPLILQQHELFELDEIDETYVDRGKVCAMHGPFMEFVSAMHLNLQDARVIRSILTDLYNASGLEHESKDVVEFWDSYILPILRAKGLAQLFDLSLTTTDVWKGRVKGVAFEEVLTSEVQQDTFIKGKSAK